MLCLKFLDLAKCMQLTILLYVYSCGCAASQGVIENCHITSRLHKGNDKRSSVWMTFNFFCMHTIWM